MTEGDIKIAGDRIEQVGGTATGDLEISVSGNWVFPGLIDDQVHFREPGFENKGTIETESRAAIAGGITSYMEMPNCIPQTINATELKKKHQRAARSSWANYGFYFGATNDNLEEIKSVDTQLACGIKVFMGASTGNMLVDDLDSLEGIFKYAPLLVATHCEDTPTIEQNEARAREEHGQDVPASMHPEIRSEEACYKSSSLAVDLARRHGTRLHVLHLTTAKEMELFEPGPLAQKHITAEVCAHHLYFNDSWYTSKGADIKCNPAIKKRSDQLALRHALLEDRIDVVATDHAPHTRAEKDLPFIDAPAGLPLVQFALLSLIEQAKAGEFSPTLISRKFASAPAELFQVKNRGSIREGYFADLVVVDHDKTTLVNETPLFSKCGWTPFAGVEFSSNVTHTFVNGSLVYDHGQFAVDRSACALEFDR